MVTNDTNQSSTLPKFTNSNVLNANHNKNYQSNTGSNNSNNNDGFIAELLKSNINDLSKQSERIEILEKHNEKYNGFIKETTKLTKLAYVLIIVLFTLPILQLIICGFVVYNLGIEDKIPFILKAFLGLVSLATIIELIEGAYLVRMFPNRLSSIEERVKNIENIIKSSN